MENQILIIMTILLEPHTDAPYAIFTQLPVGGGGGCLLLIRGHRGPVESNVRKVLGQARDQDAVICAVLDRRRREG
jgi:hypothetical protein